MIEFSSSLKLNKSHVINSPFNEDPKNIFFPGRPWFRGRDGREIGNNRDIYFYANRGVVIFKREYQSLPPGTKILVMPQFSHMADQLLEKNMEKLNFQAKI